MSDLERFPRHAALWELARPPLAGRDLAHDPDHALRVHSWAVRLAPEADADPDLAGAAALVHDLDATPKNDPARPLGGERSAALAAGPLAAAGYDARETAVIVAAVATSSWSRGLAPANAEGRALQEADRLDAIGAVGVARCFACHGAMAHEGARLLDPDDPRGAARALDDGRIALDHFFAKLLLIAPTLTLPSARREGRRRHAALELFVRELAREAAAAKP